MARAPFPDPSDVDGAAEIVPVGGLRQPAPLAGGLAGRPAPGGGAVSPVPAVTPGRPESPRTGLGPAASPPMADAAIPQALSPGPRDRQGEAQSLEGG